MYGLIDSSTQHGVAAFRITVGGSLVARWSMFGLRYNSTDNRVGLTLTPIVITQRQVVLIEQYVSVTVATMEVAFLGVVVEKRGRVINI